jgi:hypothetical protein
MGFNSAFKGLIADRDSSVGIAIWYCRTVQGSNPGGGWSRFSAPVQTSSGANPTCYTVGAGSFPGVKRPECGVYHPPPSSADIKERAELYIYSHSGPSWPVLG